MAKKSLGQNFLFDPAILGRIIEAASIGPDDTIVEIGPGPGRLTTLLSKVAKKVVAIELDSDLYIKLQDELAGRENVELVLGELPIRVVEEPNLESVGHLDRVEYGVL